MWLKCFIMVITICSAYAMVPHKRQAPPTDLQCPEPKLKEDFEPEKYVGDWYQAWGIPTFFSLPGTKCIRASYKLYENGTVGVHNMAVKNTGEFDEVCGFAVVANPSVPSSLLVKFPSSPAPGAYKVLETDYENYAAVYSCATAPAFGKIEYGWVLTRSRCPDQQYVDAAFETFKSQGLDIDKFEKIDQGDSCTYKGPIESCSDF